MFHENLLEQILDLPDALILIQEVNNRLNEERQFREKFYNDIDESIKAKFINGEMIVHSPVMKRHKYSNGVAFPIIKYFLLQK